jgi:hypothetical protein
MTSLESSKDLLRDVGGVYSTAAPHHTKAIAPHAVGINY